MRHGADLKKENCDQERRGMHKSIEMAKSEFGDQIPTVTLNIVSQKLDQIEW